ncbi:von Willebrand factor A domain-containing protein 5A [Chelonia mydas]|uniref:von Willebrand factor A domain-containing protein 5A n=1 Tax=Chelonia mydas TaxID=8469 RepID=M7CL60_CHEMY|nr:von Willebrand factor A domain-containing protein 5A [Chelonia mydas]
MGDPALMVTLLPSLPEAVPGQSPAGEFIFLLDRSGSMACPMDGRDRSPQRIDSAKEQPHILSGIRRIGAVPPALEQLLAEPP